MANGIDIVIGAEVSGALQGLQKVEAATVKAGATINKLPAAINSTNQALAKIRPGSNEATASLINLSRVAQDAPYGFIGIANNINPLLESFQRLKASTGTTGGALKALGKDLMGGGGLGLAIGVVSSLLVVFGDKIFGAGKKAKEAAAEATGLKDALSGIYSETAKEATQVGSLIALLGNETETRQRKLAAIKELQQIQPEVFNNLKLEGDAVVGLDGAYKNYLENLRTVIAVKIKQSQLEQIISKQLQQQGVTLTDSEKKINNFVKSVQDNVLNRAKNAGGAEGGSYVDFVAGTEAQRKADEQKLQSDIDGLLKDISGLSKGIKVKELGIKPEKIKIDFEAQFAKPITLAKPIPVQGRIFDFNVAQEGTDLLKKLEYEFGDRLKSMEGLVVSPKIRLSLKALEDQKYLDELSKYWNDIMDGMSNIIFQTAVEAFSGIGEGIGAALSGGGIKEAFQGVANALASGFQALGKQMIAAAPIIAALKKAISSLNPAILLPAGIGLVAIGAALKGAMSSGFGGFRAAGGPVGQGQSYVVGENGPELFVPSNSGRIMNGNQVAAMSYSGGGSSSGGRQIVRGQNILLAYARTNRAQNRLGRG